MARWKGVGDRIKERLRHLGYWENDKPNVSKFCDEKRYRHTYFYRWVSDETTPDPTNLDRLATDLGVTPWWLLFGPVVDQKPGGQKPRRRKPVPTIAGGSEAQVPDRGIMSNSRCLPARARGRRELAPQIVTARHRRAA